MSNSLADQNLNEREQKVGRLSILKEERLRLRIHIDAMIQSLRLEYLGRRDVDYSYVSKINFKNAKFVLADAEKKCKELVKVEEEIAALATALGMEAE